ncbi:MAG: metalloregulator ArsR/SmtB family transcription factor [Kofleriaceae bacterium]
MTRSTQQADKSRPGRDQVFRALGDPTRRAILDRLRQRGRGVNELCAPFAMSQPAISQHLKVLSDAGLVSVTRNGRERIYRLRPAPLRDAHDWLGHFEQFWSAKLDGLGAYLDAEAEADDAAAPRPGARAGTKTGARSGAKR